MGLVPDDVPQHTEMSEQQLQSDQSHSKLSRRTCYIVANRAYTQVAKISEEVSGLMLDLKAEAHHLQEWSMKGSINPEIQEKAARIADIINMSNELVQALSHQIEKKCEDGFDAMFYMLEVYDKGQNVKNLVVHTPPGPDGREVLDNAHEQHIVTAAEHVALATGLNFVQQAPDWQPEQILTHAQLQLAERTRLFAEQQQRNAEMKYRASLTWKHCTLLTKLTNSCSIMNNNNCRRILQ